MWAVAPSAMAQDTPAATDDAAAEEITVTARRRSETLFETPATVSAISGATLRKFGAADMSSMMQLIPNAIIPADPQGFQTYINIRGIRQVDPQAEPNFGVYRNGIYAGGQRTNFGAQVDIERFEVLRGPQGGLYGRDAVGGAINVIYATPKDEFGGYASASYGRYERFEVEGAVNVPVSDDFAVRVAGWYFNQNEGEFYNIFLDEQLDKTTDQGIRASARYDFDPQWSVTWIAEYQKTDTPSARTYAPDGIVTLGGVTSPEETPKTVQRDTPLRADTRQFYFSQDISYETQTAGTFQLLAAYRNYKLESLEDQDYTALDPSDGPFVLRQAMARDEAIENVYGELVWSSPQDQKLTWVAGASYFWEKFDFARVIETDLDFSQITFLGFPPIGTHTAYGALPGPGTKITTEAFSIFADFEYAITDSFSLTASLRYNSDTKELDYSQYVYGDPATLPLFLILFGSVIPPFDLKADPTFDHLSPSVGFHYQMGDSVNFYGLISDGFRAGGFNTTSTSPELIPFGAEKARNYELGVKTQWLDGDLGVNLAVFFMTQDDLLVRRNDPTPNPFGFTYLENAGDAETWGAELEIYARLSEWLTGAATVGWLDAEYTKGDAFGTPLKGNSIPFTRNWTVNLRLDADIPLEGAWSLIGTVNYRGEHGGQMDDFGVDPYENLDKLDASVGFAYDNTRVVAYIDNAFDDVITEFIFGVGARTLSYGQTYGVRVSTDF
jgi:iron complex outermembrane receptor protein